MAKDIKIIHMCNHIVTSINREYGTVNMFRNLAPNAPDTIPANFRIVRIDSIKKQDGTILKENVNYRQSISPNIIEWTELAENPVKGEEYFITANFFKYSTVQYKPEECERCGGNRWFVSMVNSDNEFSSIAGAPKLIQYFLKTLYDNDPNRKTIYDLIGSTVYNTQIADGIVEQIVNSCAEKMIRDQRASIAKGVIFEDDELLEKIIINKIYYIKSETAYVVSLKIQSKANLIIGFNLKL